MLPQRRLVLRISIVSIILLTACTSPTGGGSPPASPTNVTATPGAGSITITWQDNSDNETGFLVYREVVTGSSIRTEALTQIAEVAANETSYQDDHVSVGTTYRYAVAAKGSGGPSGATEQAGSPVEPLPPTGFAGAWQGTWTSESGESGIVIANVTQAGTAIGGLVRINDSFCGLDNATISGTASGNTTTFGAIQGDSRASFIVTLSGDELSGTYQVTDGVCAGDQGTIALTRDIPTPNAPPTANAQDVTSDEDTPVGITLTGSDPEGDPLTYYVLTGPSNGVLTGTAPELTFTPFPNFHGSDSFTFSVNDGVQDSPPATVDITVEPIDDAPVITSFGAGPNPVDVGTPITFSWEFTDPDGGDGHLCTLDVDGDATPETTIDPCTSGDNHAHTYTGSATFDATLTVEDRTGLSDTATTQVEVTAPSSVIGNVFLASNVGSSAASDTISFVSGDAADQDFLVSGTPAWLAVTPSSGTVAAGATQELLLEADACSVLGAQEASLEIGFASAASIPFTVFRICSAAPGDFDVQLLFFGDGFTAATLAPFIDAEQRWESVITGDIEDIVGASWPANDCLFDEPGFPITSIDDVAIAVRVGGMDGPGGILARAGPCRLRASGPDAPLTSTGAMEFDVEDISALAALLEAVILHEMGHVLGIGTLWDDTGLLDFDPPGSGTYTECLNASNPSFTGPDALAQYDILLGGGSGATGVPVADGGGGIKCGHWDEQDFGNELMTGYFDGAGGNPLSSVTAASFGDIGYTVDLGAADSYGLPLCSPNCNPGLPGRALELGSQEIIIRPVGGMTVNGGRVDLPR